jgi:hypothetical protein
LNNTEEARDVIVPAIKKAGLDPAQIKYLVMTHGHDERGRLGCDAARAASGASAGDARHGHLQLPRPTDFARIDATGIR